MTEEGSTALYVGDLGPDVTEDALFNTFCVVGPVISIHVCRHHITNRSLGYAYVNFNEAEDAERALDTLNYTKICGRACRIMWSQRDPYAKQLRKNGSGNVYVSNLDASIDNRSLLDTFSIFGDILSSKVAYDKEGKSRGFGFVHFADEKSAKLAIEKVSGQEIAGKKVFCSQWQSRTQRDGQLENSFTNVYVKNFPTDWTEDDLKKLFGDFGEITGCKVSLDDAGKSRQFGFVTFKKTEQAKKAVEELNDYEVTVDGEKEKLFVGRAQSKRERTKYLNKLYYAKKRKEKYEVKNDDDSSIYVKNFDDKLDDAGLKELFKKFGTIKVAKVITGADGASKGYGFVTFETPEEAKTALEKMNDVEVSGKKLFVDVAKPPARKKSPSKWNSYNSYSNSGGGSPYRKYSRGQYPSSPHRSNYYYDRMSNYGYMTSMPQRGYPKQSPRRMGHQGFGKVRTSEQKQQIGEKLFPRVQKIDMSNAAKITGMLLEMETSELVTLEHSDKRLRDKVRQAQEVLKAARVQ